MQIADQRLIVASQITWDILETLLEKGASGRRSCLIPLELPVCDKCARKIPQVSDYVSPGRARVTEGNSGV